MLGRLKLAGTALAALIIAPVLTAESASAQARVRVLVPDLFPTEGQDRGWGEDVSEDLRDMINELSTHQPIDRDDIKDQLDEFDMDMDELTCISTIQLAPQINAGVAFCASFRVEGDNRTIYDIEFRDPNSATTFPMEGFTVHKDEKEEAAQRIAASFDELVQTLRTRDFCFDYAQQEDWEASERTCSQVLEVNASDTGARYQLAQTLRQLDRNEEALANVEQIIEIDPYHEDALNLAGYLATQLDQSDKGREYYGRYLEVNPNADAVRRRIAYDMYTAGDAEGAMLLLEDGLEGEGATDLMGDLGSYAMEAARQATPEGMAPGDQLPTEVVALYQKAIDALTGAFEVQGDSMEVGAVRNVVSAYVQIGQTAEGVAFAEEALGVYGDDPALLSVYSTALQRMDRIDDAVQALARIEAIDPEYPDLYARQANLFIAADRRDDALPLMQQAVQRGADPNRMAQLLFSDAYSKGLDSQNPNRNLDYGIEGMEMARSFDLSPELQAQMDFWHGYGLYLKGIAVQEPATLASAQSSLPLFERSLPLLRAGASYAPSVGINPDQIIGNVEQYMEIQNAIIRRGR
ncbi:tetratricopeptide repeat protein [Gaopeijia maritima]|uniref:Tetratricopeptide repeat protein n=1 Tax=Gaopeijia maritima TaxID=3119007 RepID=A0ABU9EBG4_9BACT